MNVAHDKIRERMRQAADAVEAKLPKGSGFILLAFAFGEGSDQGRVEFMTNANRVDCCKLMQEFIDHTPCSHH